MREKKKKTEGRKKKKKGAVRGKINVRKPALKRRKIFASMKGFSVHLLSEQSIFFPHPLTRQAKQGVLR